MMYIIYTVYIEYMIYTISYSLYDIDCGERKAKVFQFAFIFYM